MKELIAYYRVSTADQHLGIDAQKEIVRQYCRNYSAVIIQEYEEHESGKNNNRPFLGKALSESIKTGASLIVAKIDRLTRVAHFGLELCERYSIIFCDHPEMGTLEQSIFFGLAQQERELISLRTKAALSELKKKGIQLGAPHATFTDNMRIKSLEKRRLGSLCCEANRRAYAVASVMTGNYSKKARFLNEHGFLTSRGGIWRPQQVKRLIELYSVNGTV